MSDLERAFEIISQLEQYKTTNRLEFYVPYPYQSEFHNSKARHRALMAANQVGKTFCGAMETAMHATGIYPDWWEGHRFDRPVEILIGSNTNETCRDICQKELFGEPQDPDRLGTGTIPKSMIAQTARKPGVLNAYDSVLVKNINGGYSKISFRAYEQGPKKFMGLRIDVGWCDEEPPAEIWSQFLRATFSTNGILFLTFTPENGVTTVVHGFINDLKQGQELVRATWDDAAHMTAEIREQNLAGVPEHERDMRSKGIPQMGSGLVFPVSEEEIRVEPFEIPPHFARICGIDFGWEHPFAAVWIAWDRDTDVIYVYDCYREKQALMAIHADAVNRRGDWIPIVWPHDGLMHDKKSGQPMADIYRNEFGMNMRKQCFSNPPAPGQKEGSGGAGVEVGVMDILNRIETGRFKVFSHLDQWFQEYRMYHRQDGKIVKLHDDLMSATRYASMSLRFATTQVVPIRQPAVPTGLRNW